MLRPCVGGAREERGGELVETMWTCLFDLVKVHLDQASWSIGISVQIPVPGLGQDVEGLDCQWN